MSQICWILTVGLLVAGSSFASAALVNFYTNIHLEGPEVSIMDVKKDVCVNFYHFNDKISSIYAHGGCVEVYKHSDCSSRFVMIAPNRQCTDNLMNCGIIDAISSFKLRDLEACQGQEMEMQIRMNKTLVGKLEEQRVSREERKREWDREQLELEADVEKKRKETEMLDKRLMLLRQVGVSKQSNVEEVREKSMVSYFRTRPSIDHNIVQLILTFNCFSSVSSNEVYIARSKPP